MKIVLATNNLGKIKEIQNFLPSHDVVSYQEFLTTLEIEETGDTFAKNAKIKAQAIYELLASKLKDFIVIADDSGLSVEALEYRPNIFSARYAGLDASDTQNLEKIVQELQSKNLTSSKAFYTAAICIAYKGEYYTTHGWCHGEVITTPKGSNGFGYDPIFIPDGFSQTFGELDPKYKKELSHRAKAIELAMVLVESLVH